MLTTVDKSRAPMTDHSGHGRYAKPVIVERKHPRNGQPYLQCKRCLGSWSGPNRERVAAKHDCTIEDDE